MALARSKSLSLLVRGRIDLLLLGLFFVALPTAESHPAPFSLSNDRNAIHQESRSGPETLEPGRALERRLAGGESHLYEIRMTSEQSLRLVVEQRGIDVALRLFGPDGKQISFTDNVQSERGAEVVWLIAKDSGTYRLEVRSNRKTDQRAPYEIKIGGLHPANEQDRAANTATGLIAKGNILLNQQTTESLAQAIATYHEAIPLLEVANDLRMKAIALNKIGNCYSLGSENQKAIEYHSQALLLTGAADDRQVEALTLLNLGQTSRANGENQKGLDYLNRSLELWRLIEDRRGELEASIVAGSIYFVLGKEYEALVYYHEALQLSRDVGDQRQEARLA